MSGKLIAGGLTIMLLGGGCENSVQDMYDQAKYKQLGHSSLWRDQRASRPQQTHTVSYSSGALADTSSGARDVAAPLRHANYSRTALERGRDRYRIFCQPCHGIAGDGNGYIVERGFPAPPSYHSDAQRALSDQTLFDVIEHGYGAMYPHGDRIDPNDGWAIVAYVRALQRAHHGSIADVPLAQRAALEHTEDNTE